MLEEVWLEQDELGELRIIQGKERASYAHLHCQLLGQIRAHCLEEAAGELGLQD